MPKEQDIVYIIEHHCIPEIINNIGIKNRVIFDKSSILYIIKYYKGLINTSITSGIREYYRIIEKILLELNKQILLNLNLEDFEIKDDVFMALFDKIKDQINYNKEIEYNHMYI